MSGNLNKTTGRWAREWGPYLVMLPALLFLFATSIFPLGFSLIMSFFRWRLLDPGNRAFVGLQNFYFILRNPDFWNSVKVTVTFVAISVGLEFVLGFALALLFVREMKGMRVIRSLMLISITLSPLVSGLLWRYMLNVDYGVINYLLRIVGIGRVDFLSNLILALPTIAVVDVWQWTPFMFLILLSGLQALPHEPFEAAAIDGATSWETFWQVTWPLMRYPVVVALLLRSVDAFRVYDLIFMMTRGGPVNATDTLSWRIYNIGFRSFDMSYASALSWILLLLVMVGANLFIRFTLRRSLTESSVAA